ncbi:hypothetical protein E4T44_01608 [Aureobasidium sp. EXF-8845]|nr:hypothetical protein E4T44_01608 [Aureobasidium sp. EXF-8845]KAI4856947.1 hypothetical protein E4T45_01575 [Aureobasidium sp. EXF-8846]
MAPPPRAMYKPVDAQFVLELIQKQGLVRLVTPGDNLQCGLYAVAMGLRTDDNLEPLNFNNHYSQECMQFDQLVKCVVSGGQELRANNKALPAELLPDLNGFFGVDMLSYIVAQYNHSVVGRDHMIKVYAISPDATYEISSPIGPHHPFYGKDMKNIFIHNIDNVHWEGYGHQGIGELSRYATISASNETGTASSTDKVTIPDDKYEAAKLLFCQTWKLAPDVEVPREEVLDFIGIDEGPDEDSDFEDDSPTAQSPPIQSEQLNTGAENDGEFADVIKLHPMAGMDPLTEDTIVARIQNPPPKSKDWKKVGSRYSSGCKIKIQKPKELKDKSKSKSKSKWYPDHKVEASKNIDLTFSLESVQGCAPRLRLTLDLLRENPATDEDGHKLPAHSGSIDLAFGHIYRSDTDTSTAPNQIFNLEVSYKSEHPTAMISFDTMGATANNLKCLTDFPNGHDRVRNISINSYEREMTKKLCSLTTIPEGQGNVSELQLKNMAMLSYKQLRYASSHKPIAQFGQMGSAFQTYDANHSCLPEPPRYAWQDADEALARLATSVHVQHVEETVILGALEGKYQTVKLLTIGDMVLLCIKWDKPLRAGLSSDERITFPVGSQIKASIHDTRGGNERDTATRKPIHAYGKVISNLYDVACDVVVAVDKQKAEDFVSFTTPLRSSKSVTSYKAMLSCEVASNSCSTMINCNLAIFFTCSREQAYQALQTLKSAHNWDKAQRAHINSFLKAPGGMALPTGSSGSGKTEVMIWLIWFCLQVGIKVIVVGAKHATLDLIVSKFIARFPKAEKPLRAYTASIESFTTSTTEWKADENEVLFLDLARAELAESQNKRSRMLLTNSIQHRVIENSNKSDMPAMKRKFPSGSEKGEPVYTDTTLYDFRQIFRDGLAARNDHPFSDEEFWTTERFSRFKYAYAQLRAEVIRNSSFLVSTLINIASKEISQNFSQSTAIARFDDEAQTIDESSSVVPIAVCHWSKNVCIWAMYGDLRQSGVINLTGRHFDDTVDVFYQQAEMSLFARVSLAGHSVDRLDLQWRQHEKIFQVLNKLHYFMSIRTKNSMKGNLQEHTTLMARITGLSDDSEIAAQTDYQKRLLHVVVDSPTMKAKDSKSRANPGFAAYVVDIVLPKIREDFGKTTYKNVMLIVPYAKQKELYRRLFAKLRGQGWTDAELPQMSTIDVAHGHEADLVIFDVVNDDYEGFLQDKKRCCVAFDRAKQQMIVISGALEEVDERTATQIVRDATDGDKIKPITLKRPLLHWASWVVTVSCTHKTSPPAFIVPADLSFWNEEEVEPEPEEATATSSEVQAKPEEVATASTEVELKPEQFSTAFASEWDTAPNNDDWETSKEVGGADNIKW